MQQAEICRAALLVRALAGLASQRGGANNGCLSCSPDHLAVRSCKAACAASSAQVVDAELGEDARQVHLDGSGRDEQLPGGGAVSQVFAGQADLWVG